MNSKHLARFLVPIIALAAVVLLAGPGAQQAHAADKAIVVGSKIDTEGALLGQIIVQMLQANGFAVTDKTELGGTPILRKAIAAGQVDIYPEYTGNGAFFFKESDPDIWKNAQTAFETVSKLDKEQNDIVWLKPAPANNTWAIATRQELADKYALQSLEDFAAYAAKGEDIKLAGCEEFVSRPDALPSFQDAYGFELTPDQLLVFSNCNTAQTEQAAAQGTDGVNFAMAFGTDGALSALNLVVLEDTRGVQPVYEPAPIVRQEVLTATPEIATILAPVFASLDQATLQRLNSEIAIGGQGAKDVAHDYLVEMGFLK